MEKYILVCCEESQAIATAFRKRGFMAFSNDLIACSGGHPEYHIIRDCLSLLDDYRRLGYYQFTTMDGCCYIVDKWDLIIVHPPCTYLSKAGACRFYTDSGFNEERYQKGLAARDFFMRFYNYKYCDRICIENPVAMGFYNLPPYSMIINPYDFGDPYMKRTCLWLKGLPGLFSTSIYRRDCLTDTKTAAWYNKGNSSARQCNRSKTFPGIAEAMALQWGDLL